MPQNAKQKRPQEGDLCETYYVEGHVFPVRYGYYTALDRRHEPSPGANLVPILPDFYAQPRYNGLGLPLAANTQAPCAQYQPHKPQTPEQWCRDCVYYPKHRPVIGLCSCPARRLDHSNRNRDREERG